MPPGTRQPCMMDADGSVSSKNAVASFCILTGVMTVAEEPIPTVSVGLDLVRVVACKPCPRHLVQRADAHMKSTQWKSNVQNPYFVIRVLGAAASAS